MRKRSKRIFYTIVFLIIAFILAPLSRASSYYLTDSEDIPFSDQVVRFFYHEDGLLYEKLLMSNNSGYINLEISDNIDNFLDFKIDTAQGLYFGRISKYIPKVKLEPIARLSAFVIDGRANLLKGAGLKIICSKTYSSIPNQTNEIGYFSIDNVGFGKCEINIIRNNIVRSWDININESKEYSLKIIFPEQEKNLGWLWLSVISIFLIGVCVFFYFRFFKDIPNKNVKKCFSRKQMDIMKTLSENENKIIEFLFFNNNIATQSKIRYNTNIPKSSLHRYITKLQQKSIINAKEFGKLKKIELTDFFLK